MKFYGISTERAGPNYSLIESFRNCFFAVIASVVVQQNVRSIIALVLEILNITKVKKYEIINNPKQFINSPCVKNMQNINVFSSMCMYSSNPFIDPSCNNPMKNKLSPYDKTLIFKFVIVSMM